jgi:hypothetical protein
MPDRELEAQKGSLTTSRWGIVALVATVVSALGFFVQSIPDIIGQRPASAAIIGAIAWWGVFVPAGLLALIAGIGAVVTGLKRRDRTLWLGIISLAYLVGVQTLLSLWDPAP